MKTLHVKDLVEGKVYEVNGCKTKGDVVTLMLSKPDGEFDRISVKKSIMEKQSDGTALFKINKATIKIIDDLLYCFSPVRPGIIMNDPEKQDEAIKEINEQLASVLPTKLSEKETVNSIHDLTEEQLDSLSKLIEEEAKAKALEDITSEDDDDVEEELYVPVNKKGVFALVLSLSALAVTAFISFKKFKKKK